ncbi:pyruvate dehydrogenase E2 component (dihydrolipoamide acetyltransferase) [Thermocatellispora tengchongensis]|uniref:Dihydrolipoamide acetyltransferase component of pyruvate dehydrogenase complex n=1 Tax=Thermocatellispora tengchongensis TaxID=1073253 RepID=A0A840NUT7_9ACTN|nr:dihydrolipoamide acetyltransferase family protein [Thermocatellispora tengchongensis]MBB5131318.1 pyruvate dehydrogenase E2 component (dihydrolipoamide acetyltransferase) [Thermocatellispora tengchongensis]
MTEFRLPDLGEGLTEAEVLTWFVAVGDVVEVDQTVVEVETAKAAVEVPIPYAGVVTALHATPGTVIPVGHPLITVTPQAYANFHEPSVITPSSPPLGEDEDGRPVTGDGRPPTSGEGALAPGGGPSASGEGASGPSGPVSVPGEGAPGPGDGAPVSGEGVPGPGGRASASGPGASGPGGQASASGDGASDQDASGNVLVGYGTSGAGSRRRAGRRRARALTARPTSAPPPAGPSSVPPAAGPSVGPSSAPLTAGPATGQFSAPSPSVLTAGPSSAPSLSGSSAVAPSASPASGATVAPRRGVISPLVRRMAAEHGLRAEDLEGSGPGGLVVRRDVEAAIAARRDGATAPGPLALAPGAPTEPAPASPVAATPPAAAMPGAHVSAPTPTPTATLGITATPGDMSLASDAAPAPAPAVPGVAATAGPGVPASRPVPSTTSSDTAKGAVGGTRVALTGVRRVMAERVARSRREVPEATVWVDVDVTDLLAMRARMNEADPGRPVSLLGLLGRFCVAGLRAHPELNSSVDAEREEIVLHDAVHLGFAAQTPRGLVVPVVRDAGRLSARELTAEVRRLAEAGREGALGPGDLTGGTFTVNNYGVFGVDGAAPIINHPEAAMLGVGRVLDRPWAVDGGLGLRKIVQLTLVFDHRVCDGGTAGGFLRFVADCAERPDLALADL